MELALANDSKTIQVSESAFGRDFNEPLVHQVVVAYMAAARSGTKAQKTRSQVSGGGAKPFRQKGTGRARAGTTRSPIWRTGGVTFAATPRDHAQKVNKKMYRGAIQSIFSELIRQGRLVVTDAISVDAPKTKQLVEKLKAFDLSDVLIITESDDINLFLSARNLKKVDVTDSQGINPLNLLKFEKVLVTVDALKRIEERLS